MRKGSQQLIQLIKLLKSLIKLENKQLKVLHKVQSFKRNFIYERRRLKPKILINVIFLMNNLMLLMEKDSRDQDLVEQLYFKKVMKTH